MSSPDNTIFHKIDNAFVVIGNDVKLLKNDIATVRGSIVRTQVPFQKFNETVESGMYLGYNSTIKGKHTLAIGWDNTTGDAPIQNSILIGNKCSSAGHSCVSIGYYAKCTNTGGIAIGSSWGTHEEYATTAGQDCLTIGYNANSYNSYASIVIGTNTRVKGIGNIVFGGGSKGETNLSNITGNYNAVIGVDNNILGTEPEGNDKSSASSPQTHNNFIFGTENTVNNGKYLNTVFGSNNTINGSNNIVFGSGKTINGDNGVYLNNKVIHDVGRGNIVKNGTDVVNSGQIWSLIRRIEQLEAKILQLESRP